MALKAIVCTRAQTATTHVASPTVTVTEPSICIAGSVSALVSRRTDGTARGACPSTKRRLKAMHELSNSTAMGKRKQEYSSDGWGSYQYMTQHDTYDTIANDSIL